MRHQPATNYHEQIGDVRITPYLAGRSARLVSITDLERDKRSMGFAFDGQVMDSSVLAGMLRGLRVCGRSGHETSRDRVGQGSGGIEGSR